MYEVPEILGTLGLRSVGMGRGDPGINTLFPHPLDCLLGLYWTGLTLLNGFSILFNFLFFYFGSCGRLSWLNCQLSSAR